MICVVERNGNKELMFVVNDGIANMSTKLKIMLSALYGDAVDNMLVESYGFEANSVDGLVYKIKVKEVSAHGKVHQSFRAS